MNGHFSYEWNANFRVSREDSIIATRTHFCVSWLRPESIRPIATGDGVCMLHHAINGSAKMNHSSPHYTCITRYLDCSVNTPARVSQYPGIQETSSASNFLNRTKPLRCCTINGTGLLIDLATNITSAGSTLLREAEFCHRIRGGDLAASLTRDAHVQPGPGPWVKMSARRLFSGTQPRRGESKFASKKESSSGAHTCGDATIPGPAAAPVQPTEKSVTPRAINQYFCTNTTG
ncbi:hypothetical protein J6590_066456 [Homalodisca vitripennis]|nr:hypothetical protein J6590_066456 [Homalodisca vitripennis]